MKDKDGNFAEYAKSLGLLREIVAQVKARHPETSIGLTGLPVMENDEMESSQTAMTQAGILSFLGVALLYVAGFGCFRHPAHGRDRPACCPWPGRSATSPWPSGI